MFFKLFEQKRIYLDYASSTSIDLKMVKSFPKIPKSWSGANPSALHKEGVMLKRFLNNARKTSASTLGAQPNEIIFTSGATESDNLAILGSINYFLKQGILPSEIVVHTSPFEHSAITETIGQLSPEILVCSLPQEAGIVDLKNLVVDEKIKVVLVSVIFVQNEIGTVQMIKDIAKVVRKLRKIYPDKKIIFHTDATQAPLFYDLNVARLGVDMMTLGATKLYCHKGVGLLYKKNNINILPIMFGGGQEFGLRPGTENVEQIYEFSQALKYAQDNRVSAVEKTLSMREYFESALKEAIPSIRITGEANLSSDGRSPHISHVTLPNFDSELLVLEFDARGIAVSSKSACKNEDSDDSGIIKILYPNQNLGAIRFSFGRWTTKRDLNKTIKAFVDILKKYQS